MARIRRLVDSRRFKAAAKFVLEELVPPIVHRVRFLSAPWIKLYNPKVDLDFKRKAVVMTDEEFAAHYAAVQTERGSDWTDLDPSQMEFLLSNLVPGTVLDVGAGCGLFAVEAARRGHRVTASDFDRTRLPVIAARARAGEVSLETVSADLERLPFGDRSFDNAVCTHVLEHVRHLYPAIQELLRVTRRRLLVITPQERYYRFTPNYHLHFFGEPEQLALAIGLRTFRAEVRCRCICYCADVPQASGPGVADGQARPTAEGCADSASRARRVAPTRPRTRERTLLRVALVAPAYNEGGKIGKVIEKVRAIAPSLPCDLTMVVVDDGSQDATAAEAEAAGVTVLRHSTNRGAGAAERTAIDWAIARGLDAVAFIAGDDQHEPSELGRLLVPLVQGEADFVQGSRWMRGGRVENSPFTRSVLTRVYSRIVRALFGFGCTDGTNGFRAFRLSIFRDPRINIWQSWLDTYEFEPYILCQAIRTRVRLVEVPCTVRYHRENIGFTKMRPWRDWWRILRPVLLLKLGLRR